MNHFFLFSRLACFEGRVLPKSLRGCLVYNTSGILCSKHGPIQVSRDDLSRLLWKPCRTIVTNQWWKKRCHECCLHLCHVCWQGLSKGFPIEIQTLISRCKSYPAIPISMEPIAGRREASVAITAIQNVAAGVPWPCDRQSSSRNISWLSWLDLTNCIFRDRTNTN